MKNIKSFGRSIEFYGFFNAIFHFSLFTAQSSQPDQEVQIDSGNSSQPPDSESSAPAPLPESQNLPRPDNESPKDEDEDGEGDNEEE